MDQEATLHLLQDPAIRRFYTNYVGISNDKDLVRHWQAIRSRLSEYGPRYKCINFYKFVGSRLASRFYYRELVDMTKQGCQAPVVLDLGCCTGTDLRRLMFDGYPGDRLYGIDLNKHYIESGYDLFRDRATCPITFIAGDILSTTATTTPTSISSTINNKFTQKAGVVYTGSMIHLLSLDQLHTLIHHISTHLLDPAGGIFIGTHVAADTTTSMTRRGNTKQFIAVQDFKDVLEKHQFVDIQLCKEPRRRDPDENSTTLDTFWLSFKCRLVTATAAAAAAADKEEGDNDDAVCCDDDDNDGSSNRCGGGGSRSSSSGNRRS
ncbi:hypothetical protein BDB00DRAFT_875562 [Zychaea mexicana]|uniref:uncharacterized protein n=1 Tax=Zychaea mexicana TaxID=64656 RepID=UPI0022FE95E3|nr:uncharacterized protein BDB00DRAFT_875562 [Zychaea mexicana]KAI9490245.1 hypothetical protein BDB00DRAFT_875562 [Zychaea mexicana]